MSFPIISVSFTSYAKKAFGFRNVSYFLSRIDVPEDRVRHLPPMGFLLFVYSLALTPLPQIRRIFLLERMSWSQRSSFVRGLP